MDKDIFLRLLELQERKIKDEERRWIHFDFDALIKWIEWELKEVREEIKRDNKVYLEDELWDILWTIMRLMYSLQREWYVEIDNVLKKCEKKFSERIEAVESDISWDTIKKKQKDDLKQEHIQRYEQ